MNNIYVGLGDSYTINYAEMLRDMLRIKQLIIKTDIKLSLEEASVT